ncbi:ABC transporter substrate-binding protein [Elioraea sp. Yellowstone]|jgi:peptide/nickel transport system substrate-binding protein|uniref:ABC transporter substrate-binding protein n=1 Tax=Elioraea sp. Yellowstone TaxID=2592070 RepID=UPI00192A3F4A|nr:ABC transporter substrate-binding protein [Elioraea sp. Yellowstone]
MERRTVLKAGLAVLAAPAIAQGSRPLRFVPHANLAVLDPVASSAYVTRNHGFLVWDTLYGLDGEYRARPQMVAGHSVEDGGLRWIFTLREGLRFHDGEPVRGVDCVASIRRWAARDAMGGRVAALAEEIAALDDRRFAIRLKRPFAMLPDALAKPGSIACFVMPERIAASDPHRPFGQAEVIGSGPFRFRADEFVPGARVVYERFAGYLPRTEGEASFTAGPKRPLIDRVEWRIIPDPATAASALRAGEVDWWERTTADLHPMLARERELVVAIPDALGFIATFRPNHLHPPFDNAKLRRALLPAVNQADFGAAVAGADPRFWRTGVGVFAPGTPLATDAGLEAMRFDLERARRLVAESGYRGEPVVVLAATDVPAVNAMSEVGADMLRKAGLTVDYQTMDWGSVVRRLNSREPPDRGGWNAYFSSWAGLDHINPAGHLVLRGNGRAGFIGWPDSPQIEALREAWFEAPTHEEQKRLAAEIQRQAMQDVPYIPLGQYFLPMAHRRTVRGAAQPGGIPLFWGVTIG